MNKFLISDLKRAIKVHKKMFLVRRFASLLAFNFAENCNDMSQIFLKDLENHKTIFIWKQSLIDVLLNTFSLKSSVKKFIFR